MSWQAKLICTAWLIGAGPGLFGQESQLVFTHYSTDNGLNAVNIYTVAQDARGFFWLGTEKGVVRFDGRWFMPWLDASHPDYYFKGPVQQIFSEPGNRLLLRSGNDIAWYDNQSGRLSSVAVDSPPPATSVTKYLLTRDGADIYLVIERQGIFLLNRQTNRFEQKGVPFSLPAGFEPLRLVRDTLAGTYWVAGVKGLFSFNKSTGRTEYTGHSTAPLFMKPELGGIIADFFIDRRGRYWISSWYHNTPYLSCYDPGENSFLPAPSLTRIDNSYYEVRRFFQQKGGRFWAFGLQLLMNYKESSNEFINNKHTAPYNSISFNLVNDLFEDAESNLWVATDKGLYVFRAQSESVNNLYLGNKNGDNEITCIIDYRNNYLVGNWGKGLFLLNNDLSPVKDNAFLSVNYPDPVYKQIWDIHEHTTSGAIWAACQDGRVFSINPAKRQYSFLQPAVFDGKTVRCVTEDRNGDLWFGTQGGRIVKYNHRGQGTMDEAGFVLLADTRSAVNNICADKNGFLWASTGADGIYKINPQTNRIDAHITATPGGLQGNGINFIKAVNDTCLLVSGLEVQFIHPVTNRVTTPLNNGAPFLMMRSATVDHDGNIWMLGEDAVYKYSPASGHVSAYGENDGLINITEASNTAYTAGNGDLVFAGLNRMTVFKPADISSRQPPPDVVITDFRLFNRFLAIDSLMALNKVALQPGQNSFSVFFTSISFLQQQNITCYYKMEGIDKDWVRADRLASANYNFLPPGNYTFLAKCENNEGIPARNIATLRIRILPHFWQTWWFITLAAAGLAALFYYIYHLRIRRFKAVEAVRGKVARDLHDDVGATLTTINILSSIAQSKVDPGSPAAPLINRINDNSSRMMEAMDDIIWSIHPAHDSMEKITYRMREYALTLLEAQKIEYDFRVSDNIQHIRLGLENRRDVFLIYKEAVNNLVKYSRCTYAEIAVDRSNDELLIKIKDNGVGFEPGTVKKGNGLSNMQKRANALKATFQLIAAPGRGTLVILKVPLA